jgi:predicted MFS family arabinose efflux permease
VLFVTVLVIDVSLVIVGMTPDHAASALGSAALHGAGIMTASASMAAKSLRVHHEEPAAGFTVVLVALAIGTIAGPLAAALSSDWIGLPSIFVACGTLLACLGWMPMRARTGSTRGGESTEVSPGGL